MTTATLERQVFKTSRLLEYFTEKEMRAQIGYDTEFWPVAILRELIDNGLDACEAANINPKIDITVKDDEFSVQDNGAGIPASTVEKSLDYLCRVSDKAYYISPTRGQMGNALKVIYAAPYVMTGSGSVEIIASGTRHIIEVYPDRIAGEPRIRHEKSDFVKNGTFVKIGWRESTSLLTDRHIAHFTISPPTARELITNYSAFNPHATFVYNGEVFAPTAQEWEKWRPNMPTSAHWYNTETLRDLVAGYLSNQNGSQKTVREFVSEFRGLSASAKQKKATGGFQREYLNGFTADGDIDKDKLSTLLEAMQRESTAPKPKSLGIIGKDHFEKWLIDRGASKESIKYKKAEGVNTDGMPYVLELAFAINNDDNARRSVVTGLNWSPIIGNPPDQTLRETIHQSRLDVHDPVFLLIHIAKPRFEFMDRGKTKIQI